LICRSPERPIIETDTRVKKSERRVPARASFEVRYEKKPLACSK